MNGTNDLISGLLRLSETRRIGSICETLSGESDHGVPKFDCYVVVIVFVF